MGVLPREPPDLTVVYLYLQLATRLRSQIQSGELQPGDQIPSGRDLAASEKMSIATVQKSVALLIQEGWVVTNKNGTFVRDRYAPLDVAAMLTPPAPPVTPPKAGRTTANPELGELRTIRVILEEMLDLVRKATDGPA